MTNQTDKDDEDDCSCTMCQIRRMVDAKLKSLSDDMAASAGKIGGDATRLHKDEMLGKTMDACAAMITAMINAKNPGAKFSLMIWDTFDLGDMGDLSDEMAEIVKDVHAQGKDPDDMSVNATRFTTSASRDEAQEMLGNMLSAWHKDDRRRTGRRVH